MSSAILMTHPNGWGAMEQLESLFVTIKMGDMLFNNRLVMAPLGTGYMCLKTVR